MDKTRHLKLQPSYKEEIIKLAQIFNNAIAKQYAPPQGKNVPPLRVPDTQSPRVNQPSKNMKMSSTLCQIPRPNQP